MKKPLTLLLLVLGVQICIAQNFRLNLKEGETYYQKSNSNISIKQEFGGQVVDIKIVASGKLGFLVKEKQEDHYLLDTKYHSIAMKTTSPYGSTKFSSDKGADSDDLMSSLFAQMLDNNFEVKMKKDGTVEKISNLDQMFTGLLENNPDMPQMQKDQFINQLRQSYGEGSFKGNLEIVTAIFPDKDVKVNDTWTNQTNIQSSMNILMESIYTLKEMADDYAVITVAATSKTTDSGDYEDVNGMPTKFQLSGNMSGTIRINNETGWIEQSDIHQELKGNIEIGDNPQVPGGMTVPMEMVTDTTIVNQ